MGSRWGDVSATKLADLDVAVVKESDKWRFPSLGNGFKVRLSRDGESKPGTLNPSRPPVVGVTPPRSSWRLLLNCACSERENSR
jgi:hypothetical protein